MRLTNAALLGVIGLSVLAGCKHGVPTVTRDELREAWLQEHVQALEDRAQDIRLQQSPSQLEESLQRVIDRAEEDDITLPEGRETVEQNIEAADAMSGPGAYGDDELVLGGGLLNTEDSPTVALDLRSAVQRAIEHNIDLSVARLAPQITAEQITQAQAVFDTVVFAGAEWADLDTPQPPGVIPGLSGDQQSQNLTLNTGIRQTFETGGQLTVQGSVRRSEQTPSFFGVNRFYDADVLVQVTQPLLQGFGSDISRANIELAGIAEQAELENLRGTMIDLTVSVEQAYWQLVAARRSLAIQQRLHARTIDMRDRLERRVGFDFLLADLNEVNARVDQRYADVLRAQQSVRALSDQLKRLIDDPDLPVIGEAVLAPADDPADAAITFSLLDQVTTALQNRPEIETALLQIDDAEIRRVVADNAQLPILNLTAATTFNGLDVNSGFDALGETTDLDYIDYALGLEFERPWGNRSAESVFAQRTLERQRALDNYRLQAQVVTLEVKDALRNVDLSYRLIATARSQRRASALSLEVAEIQLERGGRNENETFTTRVDRVLARQDALAQAELAEVQALSDYMVAISELHRSTGTSLEQAGVAVDE